MNKDITNSLINNTAGFILKYKIHYIMIALTIGLIILFFLNQKSPDSKESIYTKGEELVNSGRTAMAIEYYYQFASKYPNDEEIHLRLGELYEKVNETEKAKIEYFRAINLSTKPNAKAKFALAKIYTAQEEYDIALSLIEPYKDSKNKEILENFGDFYVIWGNNLSNSNKVNAIRKYKKSLEFYKKSSKIKADYIKKQIHQCYIKIADDFIKKNDYKSALKVLKISLNFDDNAEAHYKIAEIYNEKNIDAAINEYEKAFKFYEDEAKINEYIKLLVTKIKYLESVGNKDSAEFYYRKIKKYRPDKSIQFNYDKNVLVNILSTRYNEDVQEETLLPGVTFQVINVSKETLNYLYAKAAFYDNGNFIGETSEILANNETPMTPDYISGSISLYSPTLIKGAMQDHSIRVDISISQKPNEWKLYRKVDLVKKR